MSVVVVLFHHNWIVSRNANPQGVYIFILFEIEVVGVKNVRFLLLVDRVVELEDLCAYNLVISVDDEHYLTVVTVLVSRVVDVF